MFLASSATTLKACTFQQSSQGRFVSFCTQSILRTAFSVFTKTFKTRIQPGLWTICQSLVSEVLVAAELFVPFFLLSFVSVGIVGPRSFGFVSCTRPVWTCVSGFLKKVPMTLWCEAVSESWSLELRGFASALRLPEIWIVLAWPVQARHPLLGLFRWSGLGWRFFRLFTFGFFQLTPVSF